MENNFIYEDSPKVFLKSKLKTMAFLQDKYKEVLELGQTFAVTDGSVEEKDGVLHVGGTTQTQYQKDAMWNAIKKADGSEAPTDIVADIKVENTDYYHMHTVGKGETLGKIAKHYFDDAMKYKEIFAANTDKLKSADVIHPDQELVIPNIA
ncbi:MAG: LysM repeat protein [Flammeovirgaceae bacterium]|jgi:LysM repeat protein